MVKVAQKRESSRIQIEDVPVRHSTSQIGRNPRHMHLTEEVAFVGSMFKVDRTRTHAAVSAVAAAVRAAARGLALSP